MGIILASRTAQGKKFSFSDGLGIGVNFGYHFEQMGMIAAPEQWHLPDIERRKICN
jgi:hypothetical protein